MSRAHIAAIMALVPSGIGKHDSEVTAANPPMPYVVVRAPGLRDDVQLTINGRQYIRDYIHVTYVGATVEQARWCQEKVRPNLNRAKTSITGWRGRLTLIATTPLDVDREVSLPGTGHPAYVVDTFRYTAQPV